jgi:hypothetical protein
MLQDLIRPEPSTPPRPPGITCLLGFADLHVVGMSFKLFDCPVEGAS